MSEVTRQKADWSDLRVFWAVAETGGFGAASRALGISQPTVTRRVEDLETRLGSQLFVRGPAGVTLTEAGELVYDHALTMERSAAAIERMVLNQDRREAGRIGISAPDGVGGLVLAPALPGFLRANPRISVVLDCGLWPDSPVGVQTDLSVQFGDGGSSPDIIATPLAHFHYAMFASPDYIELYGAPRSLQEMAAHRIVHHSAMTRQRESWTSKTAAFHEMAENSLLTNSSTASYLAIRAGTGIGAIPTAIKTLAPELVMLDIPPMASLRLWVCHHRDIARSARVRLAVNWLQEVFDPRTQPWYRAEFVHPDDFDIPTRRSA